MDIPIIEKKEHQELIVTFIEDGEGSHIDFRFSPNFETPQNPSQQAAAAVLNILVNTLNSSKKENENVRRNS